MMPMAWEAPHFVAAGLMLLLAGWLLWLNFESRLHRSFAVFLFLRAGVTAAHQFQVLIPDSEGYWGRIADHMQLAASFALAYFLLAYLVPRPTRWGRIVGVGIIAGGLLADAIFLVDHCSLECQIGGTVVVGPLGAVALNLSLLYAVAGVLLAREGARATLPARRAAARLLAMAFLLQAILESSIVLGLLLFAWDAFVRVHATNVWFLVGYAGRAGSILVCIVGLWSLSQDSRPATRASSSRRVLLALMAGASGLAQVAIPFGIPQWTPLATFLTGSWLVAMPVLVSFALVRHRLFDVDLKVRWTIARAPIAFAFLGVFFVGAQVAQNYLSATYGWVGGGVLAGLLLLGLHPLQRLGERVANEVAPLRRPASSLTHADRLELYRTQACLAWSDGTLARKERMLLDDLRERLELSLEETSLVEREAIARA
jgi:hypothetical protein